MSKFKKIILFALPLIIIVLSGYTFEAENTSKDFKFSNKSNLIEINNTILSSRDIFNSEEFVEIVQNVDNTANNFKEEDLLALITDDSFDESTKLLFLERKNEINFGEGIKDESEFIKLLSDKNLEKNVRLSLIETLDFSNETDKKVLSEMAVSESGAIAVRSLNKLRKIDAIAALVLSDEIIKDGPKYNNDSIRAAIMTKSEYFEDMYLLDEEVLLSDINLYIDFCIEKYENTDDVVLKDSIVFSLINMRNFNAVKAVINNKNIDDELKNTCISRNSTVFCDVLNNNPNKEDFNFIISLLKKLPIQEVAPALKNCILQSPEFYNSENLNFVTCLMQSDIHADTSRDGKGINTAWAK